MTTSKVVRALAGLVVLVILLVTVNRWWADYRKAAPETGVETTSTVTPTATPAATGPTVLILIDGLNYREKPDATGTSIRGLKKGEQFILVSQTGSWLQLQDASGNVGWVNNNPQYVKIQKK